MAASLSPPDSARATFESALRPGAAPAERAAALAAALHSAWPAAPLVAARVDGDAGVAVAALDARGRPCPDWADALRDRLAGPDGAAELAGQGVRVAALATGRGRLGGVAVAVPAGDAAAASVLAAHAGWAAAALERAALEEELAEREWLANLGEVVGPVTHEFNNFLNTLLLQVAVLEMSAPDALKAELQVVRRQGKQMAGVVKQLQQYRRRRQAEPRPVDLNRAAAAAAEDLTRPANSPDGGPTFRLADGNGAAAGQSGQVALRLRLAPGLPPVLGTAADLRRLCRFLVGGAAWAVAGGGVLTLATQPAGDRVALRLEVPGAAEGSLARLLEGGAAAEGPHGLELAACQSLVRRLNGALRAEPLPGGGEAVVAELPAATAR